MDWSKGYAAKWRVYEVDPRTWADAANIGGIVSARIERDGTGDAPLLESGGITLDAPPTEQQGERYLRIAMYAIQDGGAERVDVATLLCSNLRGAIERGNDATELNARSVLYPAQARKLLYGTYAPGGADGVSWCAKLLREACAAPIETEGAFTLNGNVVFAAGTTYLKAVWTVLNAGGYVMQIDGRGVIHIAPFPAEPALVLDSAGASILHTEIKHDTDYSNVPNRFTAIDGAEVATAVNDDPSSVTSTVARGYVSDELETNPQRVNGETLAQYAARRLSELSTVPDVRTYSREYAPDVHPYDVVRGTLASVNLDGDLRVVSQSLDCSHGITVTEKAKREVRTWR